MADAIPGTPPHTMFWLSHYYNRLLVLPNTNNSLAPICCMTESNYGGVNKDPDFLLALFTNLAGTDYPGREFSSEALDQSTIEFNALIEKAIANDLLPRGYEERLNRNSLITHQEYAKRAGFDNVYDEKGEYNKKIFEKSDEIYSGQAYQKMKQINDEEIAKDPITATGVKISIDFVKGKWPAGDCVLVLTTVLGVTAENVEDVIFALTRITCETSKREKEIPEPPEGSPRIVLWPKIKSDFQPRLKPVINLDGPKKSGEAVPQ